MSQELYKIALNGQVSFPAPMKKAWGMNKGGNITILDAKDALAIVPAEYEFALVEAIYPQSELAERAATTAKGGAQEDAFFEGHYGTKAFAARRKVSRSGQFVLGAHILKRWEMMPNGSHINISDACGAALIQPAVDKADIELSLPMNILREDWQAEVNKELLPFYAYAYRDWCKTIGQSFLGYALGVDGSETAPARLEPNEASRTHLGQAMGTAIIQQAFSSTQHVESQ